MKQQILVVTNDCMIDSASDFKLKALRGYDVFFASGATDAIYKLANNSFYAVIFDCRAGDQKAHINVAMFMSLRDVVCPVKPISGNPHDYLFYVPKVIISSSEFREIKAIQQLLLRADWHSDIWNSPDDLKKMLE